MDIIAFAEPDRTYRPVQIIHHYFPKTPAETETYLDAAEKNGLGGFCVNMDLRPERAEGESEEAYRDRSLSMYLGEGTPETDAVWEALGSFIDACFAKGFKVWIYDERAYPSGGAGRRVLDTVPDAQVKGLFCETSVSDGGRCSLPLEKGTLRFAAAYPVKEDGSLLTAEGREAVQTADALTWELPTGHWRLTAFYTRPVEFYTENRVPYVDLMRADVVDRFIEVTHGAYLRHLGAERIAKITAFFTDEPGLPTHGCSSFFYEKNAVAAWTEEMDTMLADVLPGKYAGLFFDTDRDDAALRIAYWRCAAKLFSENYFGRIGAWCEAHGTAMTGHLYGEETLSMQIGLNADLFGLARYMQMPGVDRLYCVDPRDVTAEKTMSSAAHLYGRAGVMTENSFHLENNFWNQRDEATPENRLNSAYYQIQLGVTNIASYFAYSPAFDCDRLMFEEYAARAAAFCTRGTHKTDVLVLIPMDSAYARFTPPDHKYWNVGPCTVAPYQPMPVQELERRYGDFLSLLEDTRFDFDLIDRIGLAECRTENGIIRTPYESFRTLAVFDSGRTDGETEAFLRRFLSSGGHLTVVNTDQPDPLYEVLETEYPGALHRCEAETDSAVAALCAAGAAPVLRLAGETASVRVRKSVTEDGEESWFIHNRGAEDALVTADFTSDMVVYTMDMQTVRCPACRGTRLLIPAKSALMLIGGR